MRIITTVILGAVGLAAADWIARKSFGRGLLFFLPRGVKQPVMRKVKAVARQAKRLRPKTARRQSAQHNHTRGGVKAHA